MSLENWRYKRALSASRDFRGREDLPVFLDQEYLTQMAIANLGTSLDLSPSAANKVGRILMRPEDISTLRLPFATEVLGPPGAGKSILINRYLSEAWRENRRHEIAFVTEGARTAKGIIPDTRITDPFAYSIASSTFTMIGQETSVLQINSGARVILADRGQIDQRVFRRALFTQGHVEPQLMEDEAELIANFENTPMQVGGIILLLIRPEMTYYSRGSDGSDHHVRNMGYVVEALRTILALAL